MLGIVGFEHYLIECVIGAYAEERLAPQRIYIDFKAEVDFSRCAATDELKETLDYFSAAQLCAEVAQKGRYFLLEKLASDLLKEMAARYGIRWGWIKVKKPCPFPSVDWAYVELEYGTPQRK